MDKIILTLLCFLIILSASAQTNTWTGSTDNDWHKSCNWSLDAIPTASHDAVIPTVTTYPSITANAHCKTISITSNAVNALTLNSSGGGTLCVSSTNGGACSSSLTDNGGCAIPSSWFHPCSSTPSPPPHTPCGYNFFVCPIGSAGYTWYNTTSYPITINMPGPGVNMTWSPGNTFVIPAMGSVPVSVINGGTPCSQAAEFGNVTWTSTDPNNPFPGLFGITY